MKYRKIMTAIASMTMAGVMLAGCSSNSTSGTSGTSSTDSGFTPILSRARNSFFRRQRIHRRQREG